jgi:hypothetical protein
MAGCRNFEEDDVKVKLKKREHVPAFLTIILLLREIPSYLKGSLSRYCLHH